MCGFVANLIPSTGGRLSHRGPSAHGVSSMSLPWVSITLEMTRLSIVDQSDISVPFDFRASTGVALAYNGEIFNWPALRAELSDGTPWETSCDAEVLARAWRRWGVNCLHRFNGMFAFVLVDVLQQQVFIARDRAGEKPLYVKYGDGMYSFASEIKALPGTLCETACPDLVTLEHDCGWQTPFENVFALPPGHFWCFRQACELWRGNVQQPQPWWSLPIANGLWAPHADPDNKEVDELEALVVDAIRLRANAEVPVALQLSGGLDSAIIQAVVRSERLYTVTFPDDGVDNLAAATEAALGVAAPKAVTFGHNDLRDALAQIAWHLDTPGTWTAVCQWFMNKQIAADGNKIVLSGEGADEIFGGYSRYRFLHHYDAMFRDQLLTAYRPAGETALGTATDVMARMLDRSVDGRGRERAAEHVARYGFGYDSVSRMARVDFYTTMQLLLRMADRMCAAFGMENRAPFLDYRIMEFGARLPTSFKITETRSKAILVDVARRLGVPDVICDQKTKKGLFLPWAKWRREQGEGCRGQWDRASFAAEMLSAWRSAFQLTVPSVADGPAELVHFPVDRLISSQ